MESAADACGDVMPAPRGMVRPLPRWGGGHDMAHMRPDSSMCLRSCQLFARVQSTMNQRSI
eukprot:6357395-Pyramimonas_sp.AAC.2